MKGFSYIIITILFHTVCQCYASSEPACSKFDYEEKLLAKTIRLESTVDDLAKTVTKVHVDLIECQTDRKEIRQELETLKNNLEKQNATVLDLETQYQTNKNETEVVLGALTDVDEKQNATIVVLEEGIGELKTKMKKYETETVLRPTKCPSTYMYHAEQNLCWSLMKETAKLNWMKSSWKCHNEGGHLIILDSMAKIKFIQYFLVTSAVGINTVWVGGTDGMEEGKYIWINGEPMEAIPWHSGEPSGATSNCIVMEGANEYDFWDRGCNSAYNIITFYVRYLFSGYLKSDTTLFATYTG